MHTPKTLSTWRSCGPGKVQPLWLTDLFKDFKVGLHGVLLLPGYGHEVGEGRATEPTSQKRPRLSRGDSPSSPRPRPLTGAYRMHDWSKRPPHAPSPLLRASSFNCTHSSGHLTEAASSVITNRTASYVKPVGQVWTCQLQTPSQRGLPRLRDPTVPVRSGLTGRFSTKLLDLEEIFPLEDSARQVDCLHWTHPQAWSPQWPYSSLSWMLSLHAQPASVPRLSSCWSHQPTRDYNRGEERWVGKATAGLGVTDSAKQTWWDSDRGPPAWRRWPLLHQVL